MSVDHVFDPRGEVILVVPHVKHIEHPASLDDDRHLLSSAGNTGTKEQKDIRIQVSARHLMRRSSYFDKLLSANWKEGRELKENGSVQITVESWDMNAFLVILRIIHGDLLKVPRTLDVEQLGNVAMIADYYGVPETRFFGNIWINSLGEVVPNCDRECIECSDYIACWLWISYFFRDAKTFKTCTSILMNDSDDTIDSCDYPIPAQIIGKGTSIGSLPNSDF